ncbi:MAG: ketoacyl-ACP synthase III [Spirochaetia bacterium]|nr:ketoacyl-ACP synthase III [Spirochaetia bacterium]
MNRACISAIEYYLPEKVLTNEDLSKDFPEWSPEKILSKTGIARRHIAAPEETSVDMAVKAAEKMFARGKVKREQVDFVILCTQSPDFYLPTSACILQDRLGIPTRAGSFDMNLGCSGFIYGLALAKGLIESGSAREILLITADTYSKLLRPEDRSVRSIFSDAAAATLIRAEPDGGDGSQSIGPFSFGTDGSGAGSLIARAGGFRNPYSAGQERPFLEMDGPGVFAFGLKRVPEAIADLLQKCQLSLSCVDLFIFHQASMFMLETLRERLLIAPERFFVNIAQHGNTVSSTIPIALSDAHAQGRARPACTLVLVGFGVGLSWAAARVTLPAPLL